MIFGGLNLDGKKATNTSEVNGKPEGQSQPEIKNTEDKVQKTELAIVTQITPKKEPFASTTGTSNFSLGE